MENENIFIKKSKLLDEQLKEYLNNANENDHNQDLIMENYNAKVIEMNKIVEMQKTEINKLNLSINNYKSNLNDIKNK